MNVLIVYGTKHGSTQQVAEAVATAVRDGGATVLVTAARSAPSPAGHDLVVVGGALYSGRWHRDARRFLKRHRRALAGVPVAVFGMGPRDDTEVSWRRSGDQLRHALAKLPWLAPVDVGLFGGVDPPKHAPPHRDLRNWDRIRTWADEVLAKAAAR